MSQKILSDIGENFEYLKTIVDNRLELIKLDIIEGLSRSSGFLVLGLVALLILGVIMMGVTACLALWLAEPLGSLSSGILAACAIWFALFIVVIAMRKTLIFKPVAKSMVESFLGNDDDTTSQN